MEWIVEAKTLSDFIDHVQMYGLHCRYTISTKQLIRCKDCKHHHYKNNIPYCDRIDYGYGWKEDDFCSKGERGTNE